MPSAEITYTRATLSDLHEGTRVTIDWGLRAHLEGGDVWMDDEYALIETKGPLALSRVDRKLHRLGARPRPISKYVAAVSLVNEQIPNNDIRQLAGRVLHARPEGF
jgi:hypothetical protein